MAKNESEGKKTILGEVVVAVAVALLVGGSAPWWWSKLPFSTNDGPAKPPATTAKDASNPGSDPPNSASSAPEPAPDFPGGSQRVYSADFSTWPTPATNAGSISLGFGNSYVMRPSSNTWIGPGRMIPMPPVDSDFVLELRFRIIARSPSASLSLQIAADGDDADAMSMYFDVWEEKNVTYSISTSKIRRANLPVPHVVATQYVAERVQLAERLKTHDWSKGNKLTLRRERGEMYFFVNDGFVRSFPTSVFRVERVSVGAAFASTIEIESIETRKKV